MDSRYTGDHTAGNRIHTDITTRDAEERQQRNRLRLFGRGGGGA